MADVQKSTVRTITTAAILVAICAVLAIVVVHWRTQVQAAGVSAQSSISASVSVAPTPTPTDTPTSGPTSEPSDPASPSETGQPDPTGTASPPPSATPTPSLAIAGEPAPPSPDPKSAKSGKQGVHPVVTFAGWNAGTARVEVSGFVSSVIELDGVCTADLTRGDQTVTVSRNATPSATTTDCGNIVIEKSRLSPGAWRAVLTYESGASFGSTDAGTVTVP